MNTEDPNDSNLESDEYVKLLNIRNEIDNEQDPYLKRELFDLYEQPMMLMGMSQPLKNEP